MKVYAIYNDDDGHNLLIPADEYNEFLTQVLDLESNISQCNRDGSDKAQEMSEWLKEELWSLLDNYDRLEGEDYYVILADEYDKEVGIVKETK